MPAGPGAPAQVQPLRIVRTPWRPQSRGARRSRIPRGRREGTSVANKFCTTRRRQIPLNAKAIEAVAAAGRLRALRAAMLGCVRCEALVKCRSQVVPGHGAAPATIAFVGLAPGRFGGDLTGIPFSGDRSGNLLRLMIA